MNQPPTKSPVSDLHTSTRLIHDPYQPPPMQSPATPVHKASTIFFPSMEEVRKRDWAFKSTYTYGLNGTPTSYVLEERLAALEGARHCQLTPSGLAAISLVNLALLQQGDEVLLPDNSYGPNKDFAQRCLSRCGISYGLYDPLDAHDLAARISPRTRLVWLEAAGSVTMEFPDLAGLLKICRQHRIVSALDTTWGAGLAYRPFALPRSAGAPAPDITIHALTKYPSGGGDVLMGSVCTDSDELHKQIKRCNMSLGLGVGMNDVEAMLRGLPSMALRYQSQDRAARQLARFLQAHPGVQEVLHPALPGSPGHEYWQQVCAPDGGEGLAAGIFSFVPAAHWTPAQTDRFCELLRLFRIGYSWGGPISLVMVYDLKNERIPASLARHKGERVIRLCIGLENPDDLQADLNQALDTIQNA